MNTNSKNTLISIIVPVYNEEEVLESFYEALIQVLKEIKKPYEIIFVNDGSDDATENIVLKLVEKDPCVRIISLSRNFGHQIALAAGIAYSTGDAIITMDGDLQHPPELIPEMVSLWEKGFEIVNTRRTKTKGINFIKRITSWGYYFIINKLSGTKIDPGSADFRLIDRKVANILNQLKEKHRFFRGLVNWVGFRGTEIDYIANRRLAGKTKYSFSRMLNFADKGITSMSTIPLLFSFLIG
ncbi:MAG: glycosyltransferase family 2 protein, partial [Methanosarcinales archaeon]